MKKGFIFTILILLCSMAVFAETDYTGMGFIIEHHLGPKKFGCNFELQFVSATSSTGTQSGVTSKEILETKNEQYLGKIRAIYENNEDTKTVYYNIYWTPFCKLKSNGELDLDSSDKFKYDINYSSPTGVYVGDADESQVSNFEMPGAIGNIMMKFDIPYTTSQKRVDLYEMNIELTDLDVAGSGDYFANLCLEVISV